VCGLFAATMRSRVSESLVETAMRSLTHRGPDGEGIWISPDHRVALGHRRLNVVGTDDGQQPIASEDGGIRVAVNGEFYGFEELRRQLIAGGHRFMTASDSEVAVHLYEELGLDFVTRLRGEFSLVLWDESRRRLIAIRDRFGVKPLLYATPRDGTLIASEAKALFAAGIAPAWDDESFFHAASMQYVPPDRTLFRGIRQVPPGCMLIVTDQQHRIERYWEIPRPPGNNARSDADENDLIQRCRDQVVEAVQGRLRADASVCFQLSGGLDSSVVLGVAASNASEPLDAYTITFDTPDYDERQYASEVARHCNARLHEINVSASDVLHTLGDAVRMSEGLCINGHLSAKYLLMQRIHSDGFKVVLTGEGADEAFAGYAHQRIDYWRSIERDDLIGQLSAANGSSLGMMLAYGSSLDLRGVQQRLGYVPAWMEAKATFGRRVHSLLNDEFLAQFAGRDSYGEFVDSVFKDRSKAESRLDCSTELWTRSALANYILTTLGDGTEMAHSVEGRVPFLDHHLWDFLSDVPAKLKIRGTTEKYILREATREFLPDRIYRREKHPFDAPPASLASNRLVREFISDSLRSRTFLAMPFFDLSKTIDQYDALQSADATTQLAWDPVLMTVLSAVAMQQNLIGGA
jgi:asparagine synthase (glutamine-hydrolysing)